MTGLSQICSIDFGGGHGATFCLVEGVGYSKFPKSISVAEMMQFCRYSKDRAVANFKIHVRGANGASFNL